MARTTEPLKKTAKNILRKLGSDIVSKSKSDLARLFEITTEHSLNIAPFVVKSMLHTGRPVYFMQIGANDGIRDDEFRDLILEYDLPGLLVEPQPRTFQDLLKNYEQQSNLIFENVAISPHKGDLTMYVFDRAEEKNLRLDVYTSTDRAQLEGAKARMKLDAGIERVVVPAATVDELLSKHRIDNISIFIIDTEGYDFEVIKLINLQKFRPALVQFEHRLLSADVREECYKYLIRAGYKLWPAKHDTFAVLPAQEQ